MPKRNLFVFAYNESDFDPSAAVLDVFISPPLVFTTFTKILAQVDTGSDMSCIPEDFATKINLRRVGPQKTRDFHNREIELNAYLATVKIPSIFEDTIKVVGTNDKVMLIGRDILNKLHIVLDGTNKIMKISIRKDRKQIKTTIKKSITKKG